MHDDDLEPRSRGTWLGTMAAALALGALLFRSWDSCARTHERRLGQHSDRLPRRLQRWEGEGGQPIDPATGEATGQPRPFPEARSTEGMVGAP